MTSETWPVKMKLEVSV